MFGVVLDVTCGFKALGRGPPILAIGVSLDAMQVVADGQVLQAGPLNDRTIGCAATRSVLTELQRNNGEILH